MTVYDNMAFGLKLRKMPRAEIDVRVKEAARILGIEMYLSRKPKALSGGKRQRVALGRAIVREPKVFLLDEPLSNLDAKLRIEMRNAIKQIQNEVGITTIYVTHDQEEAMAVSDRIAVMNGGVIQHVSTPKSIYQRPANLFVANFIGHSNTLKARADVAGKRLVFENGYALPYDGFSEKAKDGDVKVSVRPEEFTIQAKDAPGVPATVKSSIFLGLMTTYFVELFSGETVEITDVSSISNILPNGTEVSLTFESEKINVFTPEGDMSLTKGVNDDAHA
jgi:iron(III) transport system ATP-binding protein